jgi:hypothetical protein
MSNTRTVTYSSTQATECAGCGQRKHTPLRRDEMGGYVCLTCIDQRLDELSGIGSPMTEPRGCAACDRGDFMLGHADWCPKRNEEPQHTTPTMNTTPTMTKELEEAVKAIIGYRDATFCCKACRHVVAPDPSPQGKDRHCKLNPSFDLPVDEGGRCNSFEAKFTTLKPE